jgi:hypothetical protein
MNKMLRIIQKVLKFVNNDHIAKEKDVPEYVQLSPQKYQDVSDMI